MEKNITDISWSSLPWKKFRDKLFRLQCKIYKAKQAGDIKKLYSLQKLLIKSQATHYLAIKEITKLSWKTKTGLLIIKNLTAQQKFEFSFKLKAQIKNWNYLSKSAFDIKDLIVLYIWKLALSPTYEFSSFENSSKSSFNNNVWDIQKKILNALKLGSTSIDKTIIQLDLSDILPTLNYKLIIKTLCFPSIYKISILKALNLGLLTKILHSSHFREYEHVLLSSLLINLILKDIEHTKISGQGCKEENVTGFRYNCKILYVLTTESICPVLLKNVRKLLKNNGCDLVNSNISIQSSKTGFDFIDWYFRVSVAGRVICYPNKSNINNHKKNIQKILKSNHYSIEKRIYKLRPLVQSWYLYNKLCDLSQIKSQTYYLKLWFIKYLKKSSSLSREKRNFYLKKVFINRLFFKYQY